MEPKAKPDMIPETLVEATWEEVSSLTDTSASREMDRVAQSQPALLAYVFADTEALSHEVHELAIYMFFVILRMYEKHFGPRLTRLEPQDIEKARKRLEETMDRLIEVDRQDPSRESIIAGEKQPHVMRYVAECLFEPGEDEIELSEEERGALFLTLKTVIDAMNDKLIVPARKP